MLAKNTHVFSFHKRGERKREGEKKTMIDTERSVIFGLQFELFIDGWQISPIASSVLCVMV